jgi:hypothetical protein
MLIRSRAAVVRPDANGVDREEDTKDDPVLRSVLTAPVRSGQPPAWESEVLEQAASGPWFDGTWAMTDMPVAGRLRERRPRCIYRVDTRR